MFPVTSNWSGWCCDQKAKMMLLYHINFLTEQITSENHGEMMMRKDEEAAGMRWSVLVCEKIAALEFQS
jgi:hypothetical protein